MKFSTSLKKNSDFQQVYRHGTSRGNRYLVMYQLKNEKNCNRFGISVSKKVGNSVVRHRLCRVLREAYRLNEERFLQGYDIVVIARNPARGQTYWELEKALLHLGGFHRILKVNANETTTNEVH